MEAIKRQIIPWVAGNTLNLAIPLQTVTKNEGTETREDYYPPEGSDISVVITSQVKRRKYEYTLDDNVVMFTDDGTLPVGIYGIEITVTEPDGQNRRYFKCHEIEIRDCTGNLDAMLEGQVLLDAAIFIQGQKGDKGDPFTYDDFTEEQITELQKPARDAAADITDDYDTNVKGDYTTNVKEDYASVKQDAQAATGAANDAAANANQEAGAANGAATNANNQGAYAKNQGDYAKRKADEIEDAKGDYQNLDARLDAMDAATDDRLEAITEEELNAIFN